MTAIAISREDKNRWERRAPLTPQHVEELVKDLGQEVLVQPSLLRIFQDQEYADAGAILREDLSASQVILGVKEVGLEHVLDKKAFLCFSHVIKGQESNMPLLERFLDRKATLIDYEPIADRYGRRMIFFGRHAGNAGMVDALWALGQRLLGEGIESPFAAVEPAHRCRSVEEAASFLATTVSRHLREAPLEPSLHPLVIGVTGGGNVAKGALEMIDRLPVVEIDPDELPSLAEDPNRSHRAIYKVVFRRQHRQDFARHLPYLTVLVNGIYWEPGHPKLVTRGDLRRLWEQEARPRLRVVADLSCDVDGSFEATVRTTTPDAPVYVFDPLTGEDTNGVDGRGLVVLAVDNLPAEFPRDASEHFGDSLFPFLSALAGADYDKDYEHLTLPAAISQAVITHRGELTPRYRHLEAALHEAIA